MSLRFLKNNLYIKAVNNLIIDRLFEMFLKLKSIFLNKIKITLF